MTNADRTAVDALSRHFAHETGGFWEHLTPREQATYRAKALDVVQVVGPIYQPVFAPTERRNPATTVRPNPATFPRPMSKENDR